MTIICKISKLLSGILAFVAVIVIFTAVLCLIFQFKPAIVVSGSMEPAIATGSFLIIDKKDKDVKIGDIIAYNVRDMQVAHRVIAINEDGYITKGDNNDNADFFPVDPVDVIGKAVFAVPKAGYFLNWITTIQGVIVIITSCAVLILTGALKVNDKKE